MRDGLYKGYIKTKGKQAIEPFKDRAKYRSYDEVKDLDGFAGVLEKDTILIDIDEWEQSEILMNIVEEYQLDCRVYQTSRGRHFLFKNHEVTRNCCKNPITVGASFEPTFVRIFSNNVYQVDISLNVGERLEIDSRKKTVKLIHSDGYTENVLWSAIKEYYIFEKIAAGTQIIAWDGSFAFDLILIDKRSEPLWK